MGNMYVNYVKYLAGLCLLLGFSTVCAVEPGEVIINEIYFPGPKGEKGKLQAVELLVVADKVNLNGLQVSDRMFWNVPAKDQCTLQDAGQGFLSAVRSGTLIVIYNRKGTDDTDADDFVMQFYAQSSLFCNVAPTGNAFRFQRAGHCLHLLHLNRQVDFVKYRASDATHKAPADPGNLNWENGVKGHADISKIGENAGLRFLGNKPDLNDFPAAWVAFAEVSKQDDNLGEPNGGRNTEWIKELRTKARSSGAGQQDGK